MLAQQVAVTADPGYEPVAPVASLAAAEGSQPSRQQVLQARLADVNNATPQTTGGWTRSFTWRSPS